MYLLWLEPVGLLSLGVVLILTRPHALLLHTHTIDIRPQPTTECGAIQMNILLM